MTPDPSPEISADQSSPDSHQIVQFPAVGHAFVARGERQRTFERAGERFGTVAWRLLRGGQAHRQASRTTAKPTLLRPPAPRPVDRSPMVLVPNDASPDLSRRVEEHLRTMEGVRIVTEPASGLIRIEPDLHTDESLPTRVGSNQRPVSGLASRSHRSGTQPRPVRLDARGTSRAPMAQLIGEVLRVPSVRRGMASVFGPARADTIGAAVDLTMWGAVRFAGISGAADRRPAPLPAVAPGASILPWVGRGQQRPVVLVALSALGVVVLLLGTTPLGTLVCSLFPSPVVAILVSAAGIASVFLR